MNKQFKNVLIVLLVLCFVPASVLAAEKVTFLHYFSGTLAGGIDDLVKTFNAENPQYELTHTPVDHEAFKTRYSGDAFRRKSSGSVLLLGRSAGAVHRGCRQIGTH